MTTPDDVERMKSLLIESVSTLCNNGFKYSNKLKVEGLLAVTLDNKDVMVININKEFNKTSDENNVKNPEPSGLEMECTDENGHSVAKQKEQTSSTQENSGTTFSLVDAINDGSLTFLLDTGSLDIPGTGKDGDVTSAVSLLSPVTMVTNYLPSSTNAGTPKVSNSTDAGTSVAGTVLTVSSPTKTGEIRKKNKSVKEYKRSDLFECFICFYKFKTEDDLIDHMRKDHLNKEKPTEGQIAKDVEVTTSPKRTPAKKQSIKIKQEKFLCSLCGHFFSNIKTLGLHLKKHNGEHKITCPVEGCGKSFINKRNMQYHLNIHNNDKPFACKKCNEKYHSAPGLRNHMRREHTSPGDYTMFKCRVCGKLFHDRGHLNEHMTGKHSGFVVFCHKCGRSFTWKQALNRHLQLNKCHAVKKETLTGGVLM